MAVDDAAGGTCGGVVVLHVADQATDISSTADSAGGAAVVDTRQVARRIDVRKAQQAAGVAVWIGGGHNAAGKTIVDAGAGVVADQAANVLPAADVAGGRHVAHRGGSGVVADQPASVVAAVHRATGTAVGDSCSGKLTYQPSNSMRCVVGVDAVSHGDAAAGRAGADAAVVEDANQAARIGIGRIREYRPRCRAVGNLRGAVVIALEAPDQPANVGGAVVGGGHVARGRAAHDLGVVEKPAQAADVPSAGHVAGRRAVVDGGCGALRESVSHQATGVGRRIGVDHVAGGAAVGDVAAELPAADEPARVTAAGSDVASGQGIADGAAAVDHAQQAAHIGSAQNRARGRHKVVTATARADQTAGKLCTRHIA